MVFIAKNNKNYNTEYADLQKFLEVSAATTATTIL